ncbi:MAG: proline--tRNA ligase [Phycisphaerales bacterium]
MSTDSASRSSATSLSHHAGSITRWSQTIIPTLREDPKGVESPSHGLLLRAGYIRQVGAGIYDYLPLAWRVIHKISTIIRQELDRIGSAEVALPTLVPMHLYDGTKRHLNYGPLLFRLTDNKGAEAALGPTHEETITELVKGSINSYKQLPLTLYQITTKFRDEARPRSGLLRCREFLMKDAYSFHMHLEGPGGLSETYDHMYAAYSNTFKRCGLDFTVVEAESGPIGGSASHEFMVNAPSGEDTILKCPASGYAANVEKCEIGERPRGTLNEPPTGELTEVHTPNLPGIDEVGKFMKVKPDRMLKSIVFQVLPHGGTAEPRHAWVVAVVRGDHDVNEGKVKTLSGYAVQLAPDQLARAARFAIGYVSPRVVNSIPNTLLLIDADASHGGFWASGSDKPDHHVKHFNWRREVGAALDDPARVKVGDIRNALAGDPSPRSPGARLETGRGIEVGHIFKLGTKYSDAMGLQILSEKQERQSVIMGCYGIGVSRTMAASVEQNHDANGIIWPLPIAPFHVIITVMKPLDPGQRDVSQRLASDLSARGVDVLIDDRDERPGVKFKDADLIGIPLRITIGDKALAQNAVEFKHRKAADQGTLVKIEEVAAWCVEAAREAAG